MAELTELIKVSKTVKTDLEDIKEAEKHSSLDSVIRNTLEKIGRLEAENELLKKKLEEVTDERNSFQMDLNMTSLEKEREIKQLKKKIKEINNGRPKRII